jgi:hypothetical protein
METPTHTAPPVALDRLVQRLFSARAMMAPHQKERYNGKLILDCCEVIGGAVLSIAHVEACLAAGAKIQKQDGQWHIFAADGNGIKCRDTLSELLTDLPPLNANCASTTPAPTNETNGE